MCGPERGCLPICLLPSSSDPLRTRYPRRPIYRLPRAYPRGSGYTEKMRGHKNGWRPLIVSSDPQYTLLYKKVCSGTHYAGGLGRG